MGLSGFSCCHLARESGLAVRRLCREPQGFAAFSTRRQTTKKGKRRLPRLVLGVEEGGTVVNAEGSERGDGRRSPQNTQKNRWLLICVLTEIQKHGMTNKDFLKIP
jgi:hypothetical protein